MTNPFIWEEKNEMKNENVPESKDCWFLMQRIRSMFGVWFMPRWVRLFKLWGCGIYRCIILHHRNEKVDIQVYYGWKNEQDITGKETTLIKKLN